MKLQTCLLLSEDPDHQIEIAEAFRHTCKEVVVLNCTNPEAVFKILSQGSFRPQFLIIDLTVLGMNPSLFIQRVEADNLHSDLCLILYGKLADHPHFKIPSHCFSLGNISYYGLRKTLQKLVYGQGNRVNDAEKAAARTLDEGLYDGPLFLLD